MTSLYRDAGLTDEQIGKVRLLNRILISYNDFDQAYEIASLLLEGSLYENYPRKNRQLVIALNMATIIAYARPFLDSKGLLAHNRVPKGFHKTLNREEADLHSIVMEDRHTMMAHSDADENASIPLVFELEGHRSLIPQNASAFANPLLPEAMRLLRQMSKKLREHCFEYRKKMEPELIGFLPLTNVEQTNEAD